SVRYCALDSLFFYRFGAHRDLPSFPTRRSSDLGKYTWTVSFFKPSGHVRLSGRSAYDDVLRGIAKARQVVPAGRQGDGECQRSEDRKSTRLNSSHVKISYAVFCLKKKKTNDNST